MAMKRANGGDRGEKFKFEDEGDKLEGYYLGAGTIDIEGDEVTVHNIKTDTGLFSPLGSADLNRKMSQVPSGARVRVVYEGKKKLKGGKTLKVFTVDYDDEDTVEDAPSAARTLSSAQIQG